MFGVKLIGNVEKIHPIMLLHWRAIEVVPNECELSFIKFGGPPHVSHAIARSSEAGLKRGTTSLAKEEDRVRLLSVSASHTHTRARAQSLSLSLSLSLTACVHARRGKRRASGSLNEHGGTCIGRLVDDGGGGDGGGVGDSNPLASTL
jgi:hypothetical protein